MKRVPLAVALVALALPGSAFAAASSHGVVLSSDRAHHLVRIVDARHRVHDYTYRGALGVLRPGRAVTFVARGGRMTHVKQARQGSGSVSFYARIVRSGKRGVVLVLADGHRLSFSWAQLRRHPRHAALDAAPSHRRRHDAVAHMAGTSVTPPINVNSQGLAPGVTVLVTETVETSRAVTITIMS